MGFQVKITLSKNQAGPGMTTLNTVTVTDLNKEDAKAIEKAVITQTFGFGDSIPADVKLSGEQIVLHGRMKITDDTKAPWSITTQEWFGVPVEAVDAIVQQIGAAVQGSGISTGTVSVS